jgi:hypothetical protein
MRVRERLDGDIPARFRTPTGFRRSLTPFDRDGAASIFSNCSFSFASVLRSHKVSS